GPFGGNHGGCPSPPPPPRGRTARPPRRRVGEAPHAGGRVRRVSLTGRLFGDRQQATGLLPHAPRHLTLEEPHHLGRDAWSCPAEKPRLVTSETSSWAAPLRRTVSLEWVSRQPWAPGLIRRARGIAPGPAGRPGWARPRRAPPRPRRRSTGAGPRAPTRPPPRRPTSPPGP